MVVWQIKGLCLLQWTALRKNADGTTFQHDCRWELFKGARHTCFVEQTDKYCDILEKWLEECDNQSLKKKH